MVYYTMYIAKHEQENILARAQSYASDFVTQSRSKTITLCINLLLPSWIKYPYCNPSYLRLTSRALNPRQEQKSAANKEKLLSHQKQYITFHYKRTIPLYGPVLKLVCHSVIMRTSKINCKIELVHY